MSMQRCPAMNTAATLHHLGQRCLEEPASRRLDGEIYCAIHGVIDANLLWTEELLAARDAGLVLVEHCRGEGHAWIEAPPYTTHVTYAESLLPDGLSTFYRDPRRLCATALQACALANEPPPAVARLRRPLSDVV
jgi:hypothetical protein